MMKYFSSLGKSFASLLLIGIGLLPAPSEAEILVPVIPTNQVDVTVAVDVTFDAATQLYTYAYKVTSLPTSRQNIDTFDIEFNGEVLNVTSPRGWRKFPFFMQSIMSWAAIEIPKESIPPGYADDGSRFPSPFQIKPGQTLGGFSLQSPSPPQAVKFYVKGFAQVPTATSEDDFNDITIPVFPDDSKAGVTLGPRRTDNVIFAGGRRPSVDGFLGFAGTQNGETRQLPVSILIRFGVNGETVFPDTFKAALNREDVTQHFIKTGNGSERVALFELGQSPTSSVAIYSRPVWMALCQTRLALRQTVMPLRFTQCNKTSNDCDGGEDATQTTPRLLLELAPNPTPHATLCPMFLGWSARPAIRKCVQ